ncbi:MAG: glycosyltransferase family 9 protein [Candidatus Riflebacteria bacterium]|nr:glycosyltransferase family 9 protein [Candidatus Riflebacteria bacterium]
MAAELAARWDRERTRGCRPKGRQEPAQAVRAGPSTGGPGQSASGPLFSEPSSSLELARELAGAALHVGNDSGPTHLAAALGTPTIAIHGPTDPAVWAPRGRHVQALAPRPGSAWPEPDEVLEAALRLLEMET